MLPPSFRLFQSHHFKKFAQRGKYVLGLLITLQLRPETHPVRSSEDHLHNLNNSDFVKNNIISTTPNGPAKSSNTNPNQGSNLFILIRKP